MASDSYSIHGRAAPALTEDLACTHEARKLDNRYWQIRQAFHRVAHKTPDEDYPIDESLVPEEMRTLHKLLAATKLSRHYLAAREASIRPVVEAVLSDSAIPGALRNWNDLSRASKFSTLGQIAVLQAETQAIAGVKAMRPVIVEFECEKSVHPKTSIECIPLASQLRVLATSEETAVTVLENQVSFNVHPDARAHYEDVKQSIATASHEQQHDMQDALKEALIEGRLADGGLHHDALKFHFSLQTIIPAKVYSAYRAQLHELDANYVGNAVAMNVCTSLGLK